MKKIFSYTIYTFLILFVSVGAFAQDDEKKQDDRGKRPVRAPFESALLLENQTHVVPTKGTLEMDMFHRFGAIENGISDFFGIYSPGANIKLGFNYTPIENLNVGIGYSKLNKYVDFSAKYSILKQSRDWSTPLSLSYYTNMAIHTEASDKFVEDVHRLSYFHELLIGVMVNSKLSLQLAPSFSHYNAVDSSMTNDMIGLGFSGRYKFGSTSAIIWEYSKQLNSHDGVIDAKPNIAIGLELATSAHAFQVFASTSQGILPQHNMVYNTNEFNAKGIIIGFNITRLWNF